jgi:hypothetical protein
MTQVIDLLKREFPDMEPRFHDPDAAVAKGAAIMANNIALMDWANRELGIAAPEASEDGTPPPAADPISEAERKKILRMLPGNVDVEMVEGAISGKGNAVINVSSKSYGIKTLLSKADVQQAADAGKTTMDPESAEEKSPRADLVFRIHNLIWKNDRIWTDGRAYLEATETFQTASDNQKFVELEIFENEWTPDREGVNRECGIPVSAARPLSGKGECIIDGLPAGLPAGTEIEIKFIIDEEGILHLHGVCKDKIINATFRIADSMTPEQIAEAAGAMMRVSTANT